MWGLPDFLDFRSPAKRKADAARRKKQLKQRAKKAVDWDSQVKFEPELEFKADTYPVRRLFKVKPLEGPDIREAKKSQLVISPDGEWAYCEKRLSAFTELSTAYGRQRGTVVFDGPVLIPALHRKITYGNSSEWERSPWMSTTPMELLTLRPGVRFAKGRTIVAGLGLGHQLIEVSRRKQVKELVLVEISQQLVDWILPAIKPHLECEVEVVVGNAFKLIPEMTADAALIDIFFSYGGNVFPRCPNINKVWCWGSQSLRGGSRWG